MAGTLNISFLDDSSPQLQAMVKELGGGGAAMAAGRGAANFTRDWFAGLEQTRPNRMGYPRTHTWAAIRGSVQNPEPVNNFTARFSINHIALRQLLEGGVIRPGPGKEYLTLPARAEAYGHRAREFNLKFAFVENPENPGTVRPALIGLGATATNIERSTRGHKRFKAVSQQIDQVTFYWLVRQVNQHADPSVMPTDAQLQLAANAGAEEWAQAITDQRNARALKAEAFGNN